LKIRLKAIGDLREYFGRDPQEIELPENATTQELLDAVGARWGSVLPGYLWDAEKRTFRGPVFLTVQGKVIDSQKAPLQDGLEVTVVRALAGGKRR
jgi:sulfur carrier protein ThiS